MRFFSASGRTARNGQLKFLTNSVFFIAGSAILFVVTGCGAVRTGQVSAATTSSSASANSDAKQAATACQWFPSTSIFNTPVNNLPVDPQSTLLIADANPAASLHADFGAEAIYGIPYNQGTASTPSQNVIFGIPAESDPGPYVTGPVIEDSSDGHLLTVSINCKLYEMDAFVPAASGAPASAYSGAIWDLTSNELRPDDETSADAGGLPITPLLVTYNEVASGSINHVLRFTTNRTASAHVWPARHDAGLGFNPATPFLPMGSVIRLKASVDISHFSKTNQIILTAMKTYGMMLADNGGQLYFTGAPDPRWDDDDLQNLGAINFSDFEVVSMTARAAQMVNINSGQANASAK